MDTNQVMEAIDCLKKCLNPTGSQQAIDRIHQTPAAKADLVLIELGERYLAQEGKMPEKKESQECNCNTGQMRCSCYGWNSAIDACQLAMVGMVKEMEIEDMANLIQGVSVTSEDILHGKSLNTLSFHHCIKLAQSINQAMRENK